MPRLKTSVDIKKLTSGDISAVIQMAWEDRTTFETTSINQLLTPTEPDKHSEFEPQQLTLL
jgi:hypothetical protein